MPELLAPAVHFRRFVKKGLSFAGAFLAVVLAGPSTSKASDHIDGIRTALDNAADITDLYTFTSPQDPNKLVLVMNVHGVAFSVSRFSNAVDYKFRIRPVDSRTMQPDADASHEQSITCSFSGGIFIIDGKQRATCKLDLAGGASETITFDTRSDQFRAAGAVRKGDIAVFAGVRSDTWFLDLGKTLKVNAGQPQGPLPGINGLHGQNVLSIVVEADKRRFGGPLLAVTAQTVRNK